MFCSNCGQLIPDGSSYCCSCGSRIGQNVTSSAPVKPTTCKITVIRKKQLLSSAVAVDVYLDGQLVGTLFNGGMISFETTLGPHQIYADGGRGLGMQAKYSGNFTQDTVIEFSSKMTGFALDKIR